MKIVHIGMVAGLIAVAVAFVGVGRPGSAHSTATPSGGGVTVTGTASVSSAPNQASFSFGVSTNATTAHQATSENARKARQVIAALLAAGLARADVQTQDVTVGPSWNDEGNPDGFVAHSSVAAKVRDVARAGAVIDAAVAAGATETSGPSFDRSDRDGLYQSALRRAFADARSKAKTLAVEAGASLGRVLSIDETVVEPQAPVPYAAETALRASETPVEPGTEELRATITVRFSLG